MTTPTLREAAQALLNLQERGMQETWSFDEAMDDLRAALDADEARLREIETPPDPDVVARLDLSELTDRFKDAPDAAEYGSAATGFNGLTEAETAATASCAGLTRPVRMPGKSILQPHVTAVAMTDGTIVRKPAETAVPVIGYVPARTIFAVAYCTARPTEVNTLPVVAQADHLAAVAALQEELQQQRARVKWLHGVERDYYETIGVLQAQLTAAEQRAQAAETDARRYRWLRLYGYSIYAEVFNHDDCERLSSIEENAKRLDDNIDRILSRSADAAMKEEQPPRRCCPHCAQPVGDWTNTDCMVGYRWVNGVKVYHCREAAVGD